MSEASTSQGTGAGRAPRPWIVAPGLVRSVRRRWARSGPGSRARGDPETHTVGWSAMSKKTKKRKSRLRRSKANHGKRPNMGRG